MYMILIVSTMALFSMALTLSPSPSKARENSAHTPHSPLPRPNATPVLMW